LGVKSKAISPQSHREHRGFTEESQRLFDRMNRIMRIIANVMQEDE
jgi:hypothetical protein